MFSMSMPTARAVRRPPLAAVALVATLLLAACGGGDTTAGGSSTPASSGGGAFPVKVDHKYGTTEVKAEPKRVVTLGLSDQDVVLALGTKPVGAIDWFKETPYGKWPWTKSLWGDTPPEVVGERDEYNMEKIAGLKPDLILAQYSGMKQEQYDTLSKIAPVVAQPKGFEDYQAPWQDSARLAGKALGKSTEVDKLITDIDGKFAAAKTAHPEFAGKSAVVADAYQPGTYSVFSPNDPKMLFLTQLGFVVSDKLKEAVGTENVVDLSYERFDVIDVDRLVWLIADPASTDQIKNEALYKNLKVVQEKRDLFVPYDEPPVGAAMSFNTVLSIPYALEQMLPLLSAK
ncbi:iron-siderophore ABC transporter substrate-binding protein [Umezawaea endophytica]|uniref:Iron-siderophore ABC transporter substrate-binding protein n=1 Tax=Umezawaea endophytica TaxID=1654476 RepID=A0A9X3AH88_9PSEU|nr:iron-siderophore ABC transporter substrate-binding protein [Umezawaea endophytica]MCS7481127.1 iron-siderophore ABC transporter substrate-binding protein [Umezawaea endophytica]